MILSRSRWYGAFKSFDKNNKINAWYVSVLVNTYMKNICPPITRLHQGTDLETLR
jgi:hypothetical protein